jgi:isopropylmalate/homocitrate/citramalate synthase
MASERQAEIKAVAEDFAATRTERSFSEGKWSVSDMNFIPEVIGGLSLPAKVSITDLTLSRYAQTGGIFVSTEDGARVVRALDEMGVPIIETALWYDPSDAEVSAQYAKMSLNAELSVMIGYIKGMSFTDQVDLAAESGVDIVTITTGPSRSWDKAYRGKSIGNSEDEAVASRAALVAHAKSRGLKVRAAFQYPTYLFDFNYMLKVFAAQVESGADQLIVMDHGGLSPALTRYIIGEVRKTAPGVPVGLHYHDALGSALACSIAAVEAGAEIIDVAINGVGSEGHVDLAQAAVSIEALYGVKTGIDLTRVTDLYKLFTDVSGYPVWSHKPVVGDRFYELSSDLVSRAFMIDYDPYISTTIVPSAVGHDRVPCEMGMQTGEIVLARRLREMGETVEQDALPRLVGLVRQDLMERRTQITDDRLRELIARARS